MSLVGLGCNNFGSRLDEADVDGRDPRRPRRRDHVLRHRRRLRRQAARRRRSSARRSPAAPRRGRHRHQVRRRRSTASRRQGCRRRLDQRRRSRVRCGACRPTASTCTSSTCSTPASRSRRRRARWPRSSRPARCARSAASNFSARPDRRRRVAQRTAAWPRFASVQNRFSLLDRERARRRHPRLRAAGPGVPAVLPAGVRHAHGQVPRRARRSPPAPGWHRMPAERVGAFANDRNHRLVAALEAVATERGHASSSWPSPGSPPSRRSPRSSPGRRHPNRSPPTSRRSTGP